MDFTDFTARFPAAETEAPFSFKRHTTVGIGGCASLGIYPPNAGQLADAVCFLKEKKIPYFVLGNGSNILVSDCGFYGTAVCTKKANAVSVQGGLLYAECGATVGKVLAVATQNGLGGLEFLAGIPATMGGILFMNAGAQNCYIQSVLQYADVLLSGRRVRLSARECGYAYKDSRFMHEDAVLLGCALRVKKSDEDSVRKKYREILKKRSVLPKGRSLGCVFKNLPDLSAGKLIEDCGLKGLRCGGAVVSEKHANFIINDSSATAEEYRSLILRIKKEVFSQTGKLLTEEIRYIGDFTDASDG